MVILREKERCRASKNILIRADIYDTVRIHTLLLLYQIKTIERQMKVGRGVRINNTQVEDN